MCLLSLFSRCVGGYCLNPPGAIVKHFEFFVRQVDKHDEQVFGTPAMLLVLAQPQAALDNKPHVVFGPLVADLRRFGYMLPSDRQEDRLTVLEHHARAQAKQLHDVVGAARKSRGSKKTSAGEATRAALAMFAQG